MADYLTHFSCALEVGVANVAAALELYGAMRDELQASDDVAIGFSIETTTSEPSAVWLYDDDYGEPEHVIAFVLRCASAFGLKGRWGFCWALTCSKPRLDAFGGGAQVIDLSARTSLGWTDCGHWLAGQLQAGP